MSVLSDQKCSVLITGGSSGIGLALAKKLIGMGHQVIICGRNLEKLNAAALKFNDMITIQADISSASGCQELLRRVKSEYPKVNVLINNAGVNNPPCALKETDMKAWDLRVEEFDINLSGLLYLTLLFMPHLQSQPRALIAIVSSVVAFFPCAMFPVYSATKAAVHSLSMSLRHQLADTTVEVVEIVPPIIESNMVPAYMRSVAVNADVFAASVVADMLQGKKEITYESEHILRGDRALWDAKSAEWNEFTELKREPETFV